MKLGTNGACDACAGGFVATNGACEACMDFKWESIEGLNCFSATCSDEKVRGFSSNEACCKCGGGHRLATEFSYFVGAAVVGSPSIVGHPVPRTTAKYSVDKDGRAPQEGTGSGEGAVWEKPPWYFRGGGFGHAYVSLCSVGVCCMLFPC